VRVTNETPLSWVTTTDAEIERCVNGSRSFSVHEALGFVVGGGSRAKARGGIRTQAVTFGEDIVSERAVSVAIDGGYDETFTNPQTGRTTLNGQVVMNAGTITFADFVFDGQ
jgi:hypothetical protein